MTITAFTNALAEYSYLPEAFLGQLREVAEQLSSEKRSEIIEMLDANAQEQEKLLSEGDAVIQEALTTMRRTHEQKEQSSDMQKISSLLDDDISEQK